MPDGKGNVTSRAALRRRDDEMDPPVNMTAKDRANRDAFYDYARAKGENAFNAVKVERSGGG
jgi:hypothetical protein